MSIKKTLLELTQDVLQDIGADEVNSITDSLEAEEVAGHIQAAYEFLLTANEWPHTRRALTLVARSDSAFPTHMTILENLKELISVYYNTIQSGETRKTYKKMDWLEPDDFLMKLNVRDNTSANVDVIIDDSGIELLIKNDKAPQYYTSFDDENLVFDSYDSAVDTTLQISKFQAQGFIVPDFSLTDDFVPDLPADAFPLLREEATSRANYKMRQFVDEKAAADSRKLQRVASRKNWRVNGGIQYPNYGRHR